MEQNLKEDKERNNEKVTVRVLLNSFKLLSDSGKKNFLQGIDEFEPIQEINKEKIIKLYDRLPREKKNELNTLIFGECKHHNLKGYLNNDVKNMSINKYIILCNYFEVSFLTFMKKRPGRKSQSQGNSIIDALTQQIDELQSKKEYLSVLLSKKKEAISKLYEEIHDLKMQINPEEPSFSI